MPLLPEDAVFNWPADPEVKLWRYMDFVKFVELLNSKSLYFSRPDKFNDKLEASFGSATAKAVVEYWKYNTPEQMLGMLAMARKMMETCYGVSCWHQNNYQSMAMWSLYLNSGEGIAIQTNWNRIVKVLKDSEHDIYAGVVKYIDHGVDSMGVNNVLYPIVHKYKSYEHERELRLVVCIEENFNASVKKEGDTPDLVAKRYAAMASGFKVSVNLVDLIETVFISPNAPKWFKLLVEDSCKAFGFHTIEVVQSSIGDRPLY